MNPPKSKNKAVLLVGVLSLVLVGLAIFTFSGIEGDWLPGTVPSITGGGPSLSLPDVQSPPPLGSYVKLSSNPDISLRPASLLKFQIRGSLSVSGLQFIVNKSSRGISALSIRKIQLWQDDTLLTENFIIGADNKITIQSSLNPGIYELKADISGAFRGDTVTTSLVIEPTVTNTLTK